ncbi:TPA: hypothetical protein VB881_001371 [Streptococcus suis]|nr:hypothetical protein [Streptococcus suis]
MELKALAATNIAGGVLVFLYKKNWLKAIIKMLSYPVVPKLPLHREQQAPLPFIY